MTSQHAPAQQPYAILACITFDDTGVCALQEAARLAELHPSSQLHVLHVVTEAKGPGRVSGRELWSIEHRLERAPEVLRKYVEHVWARVPRKVVGHLRVGTSPSRAIVQTAQDVDADLIVVGTHRRSGMQKLMHGSVAELVMRHAHCPVFVAMPKDYSRKTEAIPRTAQPGKSTPASAPVTRAHQSPAVHAAAVSISARTPTVAYATPTPTVTSAYRSLLATRIRPH